MQIQKFKDLTQKAFKEIKEYQTGVKGILPNKTPLRYFKDYIKDYPNFENE